MERSCGRLTGVGGAAVEATGPRVPAGVPERFYPSLRYLGTRTSVGSVMVSRDLAMVTTRVQIPADAFCGDHTASSAEHGEAMLAPREPRMRDPGFEPWKTQPGSAANGVSEQPGPSSSGSNPGRSRLGGSHIRGPTPGNHNRYPSVVPSGYHESVESRHRGRRRPLRPPDPRHLRHRGPRPVSRTLIVASR